MIDILPRNKAVTLTRRALPSKQSICSRASFSVESRFELKRVLKRNGVTERSKQRMGARIAELDGHQSVSSRVDAFRQNFRKRPATSDGLIEVEV